MPGNMPNSDANPDLTNSSDYSSDEIKMLFEQYKMFVSSAEKISERRGNANKFYLGILSGFLGAIAFIMKDGNLGDDLNSLIFFIISLLGIAMAHVWRNSIVSYKELNSAKFKVIDEMEERLPKQTFKREYEFFLKEKNKEGKKNKILTQTELIVPRVYLFSFTLILLYTVWELFAQVPAFIGRYTG